MSKREFRVNLGTADICRNSHIPRMLTLVWVVVGAEGRRMLDGGAPRRKLSIFKVSFTVPR